MTSNDMHRVCDLEVRVARDEDIDAVVGVLDQGRLAQRDMGFVQWEAGRQWREAVARDIAAGVGRVLVAPEGVVGYAALIGPDAEYDRLGIGAGRRYVVFHRVAIGDSRRGSGLSALLFDALEADARCQGYDLAMVDTGVANSVMQHIMQARGYKSLGVIDFCWGERLTFVRNL